MRARYQRTYMVAAPEPKLVYFRPLVAMMRLRLCGDADGRRRARPTLNGKI